MTVTTKTIGRLPLNKGDWNPNYVNPKTGLDGYGLKFRAIRYGCEVESKMENNTYDPFAWDGDKTFTLDDAHWRLISGNPKVWAAGNPKPATTGTTGDYPYNGMGRVTLKKNMVNVGTEADPEYVNTLMQDMFYKGEVGSRVPNTDTVFVIKYDFVLGEDIAVPANCVLEFDGGSISASGNNDTITLNGSKINAPRVKIFNNVIIAQENGNYLRTSWFGLSDSIDCTTVFTNLLKSAKRSTLIIDTHVRLDSPVVVGSLDEVYFANIIGESDDNYSYHIISNAAASDPSISIYGQESKIENIWFKRSNMNGPLLEIIPTNPLGDNDCLIRKCEFLGGSTNLKLHGRGAKVFDCGINSTTVGIHLVGKCRLTPDDIGLLQKCENSNRSIIISETRFHDLKTADGTSLASIRAIYIEQDPNNENTSFLGIRIQNNTCDSMCCFIQNDSKIRNLIISGNVTYGNSINYPHYCFEGFEEKLSIVDNSICSIYNPSTGKALASNTSFQFNNSRDVIIANNNIGGGYYNRRVFWFGNAQQRNNNNILILNNIISEDSYTGEEHVFNSLAFFSMDCKNVVIIGNVYNGQESVKEALFYEINVTNARIIGNLGFDQGVLVVRGTETNLVTESDIINSNNASGNTKPTDAYVGQTFFDTSLSPARPIYWNGSAWVDAAGAEV